MQHHHSLYLLFDLDGTLADSAPGIVASLNHAFAVCGIEPAAGDLTRFIGPPLPQMLAVAVPGLTALQRDALIAAYRARYGAVGLFETVCYPGIRRCSLLSPSRAAASMS
jgi:phosphoglycolate phosphatase